MIPLSQQVCSKELAVRLKELGVEQKSHFHWAKHRQTAFREPIILTSEQIDTHNNEFKNARAFQIEVLCSAFSVAELGEMLPKGIFYTIDEYPKKDWYLTIDFIGGKWRVDYTSDDGQRLMEWQNPRKQTEDDNLTDSCAKMLVHLIENHLYDLKNP